MSPFHAAYTRAHHPFVIREPPFGFPSLSDRRVPFPRHFHADQPHATATARSSSLVRHQRPSQASLLRPAA
ncbi:hypothetical protein HRI_002811300 [Hibiscus trionum]|uniref:Uncharacterized protein n=1 Tax=Hibiscus trionum TaxID=183268 RepID=A0A9W7IBS3_HIBTR|nr:hypothetical protein HRI_002811300 [Hibiscus trionum]